MAQKSLLLSLPTEILSEVASVLPNPDIKSLRLTCRRNAAICTRYLFTRLILSPAPEDIEAFRNVTGAAHLARNVTELVWNDPLLQNESSQDASRALNLQKSTKTDETENAREILQSLSKPNIHFDYDIRSPSDSQSSCLFIDSLDKKQEALAVLEEMPEVFVEMQSEAARFNQDPGPDEVILRDALMSKSLPKLEKIVRAVCPHYCQGIFAPRESSEPSRVRKSCSLVKESFPADYFLSSEEQKKIAQKDFEKLASIRRRRAGFFFENVFSAAIVCRVLADVDRPKLQVHIRNFIEPSTRFWRDYPASWDPIYSQENRTAMGPGCSRCVHQNIHAHKIGRKALPGIRKFAASMRPLSGMEGKYLFELLSANMSTLRQVHLHACRIASSDIETQDKLKKFLVANQVMSPASVSTLFNITECVSGPKQSPRSHVKPLLFSLMIDRERGLRKFLVHTRDYLANEKDFEERFLEIRSP